MTGFSRRTFLKRTGTGAAAAGVLAVLPALAQPASAAQHDSPARAAATPPRATQGTKDPLVVHIPDTRTGEVHLMVGTEEIVTNDRALVARLLRDVR